MKVKLSLRIKTPNGRTRLVLLKKNEVIIGRDNSCDVKIVDPEISRRHACLRMLSVEKITISDLGSSNGTYLKNSPITRETRISPGTIIRLGNSFITVEIQGGMKSQGFDMVIPKSDYQSISHYLENNLAFFSVNGKMLLDFFNDLLSPASSRLNSELALSKIVDILDADNGLFLVKRSSGDTERAIWAKKDETVHYPSGVVDTVGEYGNCIVLPGTSAAAYESVLKKKTIGSFVCAAGVDSGFIRVVVYLDRSTGRKAFDADDLNLLCHLAQLCAISVTKNINHNLLERKLNGLETERSKWFSVLTTKGEFPVPSTNKKIQQLLFIAMRVGRSDRHVFIHGDHGTGRSLLAQRIHVFSDRKDLPFISMDALSMPRDRISDVLFGSDDDTAGPGLMEQAHSGTLYIQEITAVPLDLQKQLAAALNNGYISRHDDTKRTAVSVRLIVSSNVHPEKMASESAFDPDLLALTYPTVFFVPSLKERNEDILSLAKHFLRDYLPSNRSVPDFNPQAAELLIQHPWHGNISELRNAMCFTAAVCRENEIQIGDLPHTLLDQPVSAAPKNLDLRRQLDTLETNLILLALERNRNIVTKAAKALGLSESTLRYRMQRLKIEV
jgi:DNA-binding NtrC family response regulator